MWWFSRCFNFFEIFLLQMLNNSLAHIRREMSLVVIFKLFQFLDIYLLQMLKHCLAWFVINFPRYVGHTEVSSLIYTSGVEQSPTLLQNPVLLLSNRSIRALEDGGTLETANLCLHELVIDEDVVTRTLTIYGATGVTLFSKRNGTVCDVQEGLQLYVQLDEAAWRHWVPLLRDAVPRKRSLQSSH